IVESSICRSCEPNPLNLFIPSLKTRTCGRMDVAVMKKQENPYLERIASGGFFLFCFCVIGFLPMVQLTALPIVAPAPDLPFSPANVDSCAYRNVACGKARDSATTRSLSEVAGPGR